MRSYLLIESRSEQESPDVGALLSLGGQLLDNGHQVTVFLVQNAVLGLARSAQLADLVTRGAQAWVDETSLRARMLDETALSPGMVLSGMPQLVRMLMTPDVVPIWH